MTDEWVITSVDEVTVGWLTAVLTQSNALTHGDVTAVTVETGGGNWSANASLTLTYSDDAQGQRPKRLFLKLVNTALDDDESFDDSEVTYYTRDYVDVADAPLVPCYHAAYSATVQRYHLLLEDVSETHVLALEKAPTLAYGLALAEGLAAMHARWWGAKGLAEAGAAMHSAAHIQRFIDIAAPGVDHIIAHVSADLKPGWPALMRDLFANLPAALIKRTQDANGFTLIHGDNNETNILVPREGTRPIYLIDRQPFNWSLTTWLGVYDLAYAIVRDWPIEIRRQWELPILHHYHQHLMQHGIASYSWNQLLDDYKLCVPICVAIATEFCRGGLNQRWQHIWLPQLQRSLTACDDLECRSLW
ncbi:MAG: hypothetical protein IAF02_09505 [Anaerolineae bacterium]|nr:hypothetical protein [Anaerolineae bacterium]